MVQHPCDTGLLHILERICHDMGFEVNEMELSFTIASIFHISRMVGRGPRDTLGIVFQGMLSSLEAMHFYGTRSVHA